jgi:outer membrane lipase/esterase
MHRSSRFTLSALSLALSLATGSAAAQSTYSSTVFFGDSLTDSGHFRPVLVQIGGSQAAIVGRFSTNPGLVWSEFLADHYGTQTDAVSDNQGGSNYAAGGARVGANAVTALGVAPSVTNQVASYLGTGGTADPNALYTVWGGANDLFAVAAGAPAQATIGAAVTAEVGAIATLQQAGAQYVLVPNIPDLGKTPQFLAGGAVASAAGTQLATTYNTALYSGLASAGLRVIPLDTFSLIAEVAASPSTYGFVNATSPACGAVSSVTCVPTNYASPDAAQSYVFADGVHPTTAAHQIIAQYAQSVLEGPRQVSLLSHSATVTGRARAEQVAQHRFEAPDDGLRWWGNLRGDSQRYAHGNLYDGVVPSGLFGIDWVRQGLVLGGFAGYGQGKQDFGNRGGDFEQRDTTLGLYGAWYGEQAWVNGQVSYSWLGYDVDRQVQLGAASRHHTGSPDGSNLTAAVSAGFDFGEGTFRHGPVLGLVSQNVKIDGYAESGTASSALTYPEQDIDSLVGSAGWQLRYTVNDHFAPYARVTYDREFEDAPEQAFAQLQSIPGLAPYAVPGLQYDDSYATAVIGARGSWGGLGSNIGAMTTLGRESGHDTTLFVSLTGSF